MDDALLESVLERLDTSPLTGPAEDLLLAALQGDNELAELLGGHPRPRPARPGKPADEDLPAARAYLRSVTVEGFRGVGPATVLKLEPGPGLTVVCGRNGSGKSTFAEALEVLLTGGLRRWDERSAVWREGWRCMHAPHAGVSAELLVEGVPGPTSVERRWADDARDVDQFEAWVQRPGEPKTDLASLGWEGALSSYRPFLSHSELETLLAQPKDLYDQLNSLLGLDDLEKAAKRLAQARRDADQNVRTAKTAREALKTALDGSEDGRAARALELLAARAPDFEALGVLAASTVAGGGQPDPLGKLAVLAAPGADVVEAVVASMREAAEGLESAHSSNATQAASLVGLLERALAHFDQFGRGDCPVCEAPGRFDESWHLSAEQRLSALREAGRELMVAQRAAEGAVVQARALVGSVPGSLLGMGGLEVDVGPAVALWEAWAQLPAVELTPAGLQTLADHLERSYPPLEASVAELAKSAAEKVSAKQGQWGPLAGQIGEWCAKERVAQEAKATIEQIKRAEAWLKDANDELRNEQLRPFAERTVQLWAELRQESNVELLRMRLAGAANRSHVDFEVSVDGKPAAGLGVMSQGEVNALALSVFLPRATSPRSPLRFIVIDDPVQAMDPAKVAGLAKVLAEVGETRQVVVFTHDDRLPAAIRDLELPARVLQVQRRAGSVVDITPAGDPCAQLLADAGALAAGDHIPPPIASRVVPGICRAALETVCIELTRRRRLALGDSYPDIEQVLMSTRRLMPKIALAVFNDEGRGGEVYSWLASHIGPWAPGIVKTCNEGSHSGTLDVSGLVGGTRQLVEQLRGRAA